jgi:hypothetical protein
MDKKKLNMNLSMNISERDKKLLMILLSVGILAAAYLLGFQKMNDQIDTYEKQITSLQKQQSDLIKKNDNKATYLADTEKYKAEFTSITSGYFTGITQTQSIDFLNRIETVTGAWVKSVSFAQPTSIYTFGGAAGYATDMAGYKTTLTLTYSGTYEQWKSFISFVNDYYNKCTIDNIGMSYEEGSGLVNGTMTLSLYSITSKDRTYTEPEFNVNTGTDNIFQAK